jgi:hypothetical protein
MGGVVLPCGWEFSIISLTFKDGSVLAQISAPREALIQQVLLNLKSAEG